MTSQTQLPAKSPLDRFLSLFAEVKSGEGVTALLLMSNVFLLLMSYYILKPVREALILSSPGGAELKSYMSAFQTIIFLGFVPLYGKLVSAVPRRRLLNIVTLFFVGCLVLFFFLGQSGVPLAIPFFLWIGVFNISIVAQFWSFANDVYTPEQGKRLFAIVGFGASAGAVVGATSVKPIIAPLGIFWPMLAGGAVLVLSLMITNWVDSRESRRPHPEAEKEAIEEPPMSNISPYKLVFQNRYLLLIAVLILLLNWVNTSGEYILGRILKETASAEALSQGLAGDLQQEFVKRWIGEFYADFFGIVNALGLVMQLFLVSRILKYLGVRLALMILPIIALGGYSLTALFPVLGIVRWSKTGENATDYSLMNTLRGVVFLPTTREEKYKAKQAIDTIFVRLGDVLSALTVFLGTTVFVFSVAQFAWVNLVLVVFWLLVAIAIGRRYQALVAEKEQIPAQQEA